MNPIRVPPNIQQVFEEGVYAAANETVEIEIGLRGVVNIMERVSLDPPARTILGWVFYFYDLSGKMHLWAVAENRSLIPVKNNFPSFDRSTSDEAIRNIAAIAVNWVVSTTRKSREATSGR